MAAHDPLPNPPFHNLGIHNFRALTLPSHPTHPLLYRSADPSTLDPARLPAFKSLHITTVFDLRSTPEIAKLGARAPYLEIEGTRRVHAPVFEDQDYSPESLAKRYKDYASMDGTVGFVKAYGVILEHAGPAFGRVFGWLRDRSAGEMCLVNCSAGKDRTGLLSALVLMLVGVGDEDVAEEYALTEIGLREWRKEVMGRLLEESKARLGGDVEGLRRMVGARKENMLAAIEMIREKYGGAEGYLRTMCGFGDEDISEIRANITDGVKNPRFNSNAFKSEL
ncbi:MAG: hypothetical protein ASARMPRED_003524 [Alectoria sarmentosa]|nr:MAG: hypothetical protein ASARMPRED_003524 [Alectoria sarmentosa]